MIHVVTDSTADFEAAEAAKLGVAVVPLTVLFGDEQFRDGVDMDADTFYNRLTKGGVTPTTSQPSPQQFIDIFAERLQNPEDSVVSVHISSRLSGTAQSATLAAKEFEAGRIHVVDSGQVSAGVQLQVRLIVDTVAQGSSFADVVKLADALPARTGLFILLDTLTYLQRGGRIGRAQGFVGGLLSIKPMLTLKDGEVGPLARVRSRAQGLQKLTELVAEQAPFEKLATFHSGAADLVAKLAPELKAAYPGVDVVTGQIGPVVGTYAGPGGVGIAFVRAGGSS